ncbi:MAG: hypothetical protein ACO3ZY_07060, partial [Phycisphaerales bacterium]
MRRLRPANPAIGLAIAAIAAVAGAEPPAGSTPAESAPEPPPPAPIAAESPSLLRRDLPESRPKPGSPGDLPAARRASLPPALASLGRR